MGFFQTARTKLKTKGVLNVVQSVLNLVQGSNVTLTDNGDGSVTIAASGGGASITLETNGVANGSQTLLNLAAGTNVTLTDNGSGTITIAASGSGGGGPTTQNIVTGSRSFGTVFHNTTSKAIFVSVSTFSAAGTNINMVALTDSSNPPTTDVAEVQNDPSTILGELQLTFWVLPGNFYEVTSTSGTLNKWTEWS